MTVYDIREENGQWKVYWVGKFIAAFPSRREAESFVRGRGG